MELGLGHSVGERGREKATVLLRGTKGIVDQCLACKMVCNESMISHTLPSYSVVVVVVIAFSIGK